MQQQQASLTYAEQQSVRYGTLARDGWGTTPNAQQWASQQRQDEASLQAAKEAVVAAGRQLAVLKAQRSTAEANLAQATAQRDQARLNLSYTTVVAAQPGRVVQLSAAVGQYAQAGTALTMFVPDDIWVDANFKEIRRFVCIPRRPERCIRIGGIGRRMRMLRQLASTWISASCTGTIGREGNRRQHRVKQQHRNRYLNV